jgi:uncharacterized membrane protein
MLSTNKSGSVKKGIHHFEGSIVNVSDRERIASVALGFFFFSRGIKKLNLFRAGLGSYLIYRGATGHCPVYHQAQRGKYTSTPESVNISTTFIVNKPKDEVYRSWRKLENLPLFMKHLKSVKEIDDKNSHWELNVPGDVTAIQWDATIVKEEEGDLIAWKSLPGATIENAGKVSFKDALGRAGTELTVLITYKPPAGYLGSTFGWLLQPVFTKTIEKDILGFKEYIEVGVINMH